MNLEWFLADLFTAITIAIGLGINHLITLGIIR